MLLQQFKNDPNSTVNSFWHDFTPNLEFECECECVCVLYNVQCTYMCTICLSFSILYHNAMKMMLCSLEFPMETMARTHIYIYAHVVSVFAHKSEQNVKET